VAETDGGEMVMARRLGRLSVTARATSGEAPSLAAAVAVGGPPPSSSLAWEALVQWFDGAACLG
jgi:hypothetical protein